MTPSMRLALEALLAIATLSLGTWVVSVVRRDASLIDRMWPVFIAGAALVYWTALPRLGLRGTALLVLVLAWAVRLCIYITRRNRGHGEDRRYRAIRARHEPNFALKSLYLVFGLQALLAWIVAMPLLAGIGGARPLGALDVAGALLAAFGIGFESIADAQMARFKADPSHAGQVMQQGLWRYTRHPNYFGEACVWWGLFAMALSATGANGAWTIVSPLLMTVLLLKVSGVALLEQDMAERRPAYRDYILSTPAFFPRRPGGQR